MKRVCERCGVEYATEDKRRKLCGVECYRAKASARPSATAFRKGHSTWNKHLKGLHLSPATEFKKGNRPHNVTPVGTVRVRQHKGDSPRAWVKVAEPNRWQLRAVYVWTLVHGAPARGVVIHHRDRNTLNDSPSNLEAISRRDHFLHHMPEIEPLRAAAIARERLIAEERGLSLREARAGQSSIFDVLGGTT